MAKVLIVDDRPVDRLFLVTLLGYQGHRLLEAADGARALELARAERPELVIADLLMPAVDGFELGRRLRADPALAAVPVLFYTAGYSEPEARALAAACGAVLLPKPSEPEAILRAVNAALGAAPVPPAAPAAEFDREHLRVITDKLYEKAASLEAANRRLAALVELGRRLAAETDLGRLLADFCTAARVLLGARFAAVGLFADDGRSLRHFVAGGPSGAAGPAPAPPAAHRELLAPVLELRQPARRHDGGHNFLGVPVAAAGRALGWLYALDKAGGVPFDDDDEGLAVTLAAQLAVAYESSLRYDAVRRQAEQLREADRRKDEFLAMLGHELRNPLAPIRTGLDALRAAGGDPALVEPTRAMMQRQLDHLVRLVDDLLDVARITHGQIPLRREPVDLADVAARAVEAARPLAQAAGVRLHAAPPTGPLPLDADPVRLTQVLVNLLSNAVRFNRPGGEVWLSADREGDSAVVRVRDTGAGIEPELLPRVFDLFAQGERPPHCPGSGLGIGLTVVRRLVEEHGGTVGAHSAGKGRGSEFVIRLPLRNDEEGRTKGEPRIDFHPSSFRPPSSKRRVLVVDDNSDAADSLALVLRLEGHEVRVAYDGPQALAAAGEFGPEVVLLDIGLPGMDGYEVARRLRRQEGLETAVIAAVTGYGQDEDRRKSRDAGFDLHLVKPVGPEEIRELLGERGPKPPASPSPG